MNISSDDTTSSINSDHPERVNGCDVDTDRRSQSSLADSLESDVFSERDSKSASRSKSQHRSRLPRLCRSKSVNTGIAIPVAYQSGSFVGLKDNSNTPDRFLDKANSLKSSSQSTDQFLCLQGGDCGSSHSLCRWNFDTRAPVRENMTSKRRFEMQHSRHDQEPEITEYLTPSQRKDQLIKELRAHARELKQALNRRDMEEEQLKDELKKDAAAELEIRNQELESTKRELEELKIKQVDLTKSYDESVKAVTGLEATMRELKVALETKEKEQDKIYLQMYRKGRQMAQIEREEELEDMVSKGIRSPSFTIRELVRKLAVTESELAKWQSLRRKESYDDGDKPETESDATLRFLKDSFLHYITDVKESDDHLRAMIRIFNFDEDQKKKIAKSLLDNKHLKK